MPSPPKTSPASRFLGVRLTLEEERKLDRLVAARGLANRSEAIRALLRESAPNAPAPPVELAPTVARELEVLVEEGYFTSTQAAVEHVLATGLAEFARTRGEAVASLRGRARQLREEGRERRRADREGRELLRR